jgi:hypothetical protein
MDTWNSGQPHPHQTDHQYAELDDPAVMNGDGRVDQVAADR